MKQAKRTLREMIYGILLWTAAMTVILTIISDNKPAMLCGTVVGGITAIALLFHMFRHLDIALDLEPKQASRHAQGAAIQRMAIMAVCMGLSMYLSRYVHPLGMILGLFGVKIAAFMQPVIHNFCEKKK